MNYCCKWNNTKRIFFLYVNLYIILEIIFKIYFYLLIDKN